MERARGPKAQQADDAGQSAPQQSVAPFESLPQPEASADAATQRHLARVASLPVLLESARGSAGEAQRAHASAVTALLVDMRAPGHSEVEAREVLRSLDARRFDGLLDAEGRSCRKEAVETLLAMGYPQALTVSPEDLDFARSFVNPEPSDAPARLSGEAQRWRISGVVLALAQLVQLALLQGQAMAGAGLVHAGLSVISILGAIQLARRPPGVQEQAAPGTLLAMLLLAQTALAIALGSAALLGPGVIVGLLFFIFFTQYAPNDPPNPNDWDQKWKR